MKRAPISYRKPVATLEQSARLRQIEREFHVRAFGEELARLNLDVTIEERRQYLAWMRESSEILPVCRQLPSPVGTKAVSRSDSRLKSRRS